MYKHYRKSVSIDNKHTNSKLYVIHLRTGEGWVADNGKSAVLRVGCLAAAKKWVLIGRASARLGVTHYTISTSLPRERLSKTICPALVEAVKTPVFQSAYTVEYR